MRSSDTGKININDSFQRESWLQVKEVQASHKSTLLIEKNTSKFETPYDSAPSRSAIGSAQQVRQTRFIAPLEKQDVTRVYHGLNPRNRLQDMAVVSNTQLAHSLVPNLQLSKQQFKPSLLTRSPSKTNSKSVKQLRTQLNTYQGVIGVSEAMLPTVGAYKDKQKQIQINAGKTSQKHVQT